MSSAAVATALPDVVVIEHRQRGMAAVAKRTLDVLVATTMLAAMSPLIAVTAICIRATSRGPVLYRGERVGRGGQRFTALKFRTMVPEADPAPHREYVLRLLQEPPTNASVAKVYKVTRDPRVTRLGSFLRRTSLDELPQLWNVLRGEMSLVGPRPEVPYALQAYPDWAHARFAVLPGLTGLWQVCGRSSLGPLDMLRLDVEYARNWSLRLDIRILAATPRALFQRGAAA